MWRVGAGSVVVHDVGDNEVVVGNPARIAWMQGSEGYVKWTLEAAPIAYI